MRPFEQNGIKAKGNILPLSELKLFTDINEPEICDFAKQNVIKRAEKIMDKKYPVILATDFLCFYREGNRSVYEGIYFERRNDLLLLVGAELAEGEGRFSDKILDLVWMILDEANWVVPAHTATKENGLPYNVTDTRDYIDLFAASTGATVAMVYHYAEKVIPDFQNTVKQRIEFELDRRIFRPFMNHDMLSWMGYTLPSHLLKMNNWGPWIASNVLTAVACCEKDLEKREKYVARLIEIVDNYLNGFEPDGGCEEGASYWSAAAGNLFIFLEVLYDISNGKIDIFNEELIGKIGKYICDVNIDGEYYVTFADSHARLNHNYKLIARFGKRTNCPELYAFGVKNMKRYGFMGLCNCDCELQGNAGIKIHTYQPYSSIKSIFDGGYTYEEDVQFEKNYYIPSINVMVQSSTEPNTLYLGAKGGHNSESHSHNDVGNFIIYSDGKPLFIDVGVGTYSRDTFDMNVRYTIWSMTSSYHNLPDFNGIPQHYGKEFTSENVIFNSDERSLSMSVEKAYPNEAGLDYYRRKMSYLPNKITIEDEYGFEGDSGEAIFNFVLADEPEKVENNCVHLNFSRELRFDVDASVEVEKIELTDKTFINDWQRENLWRVRIKPQNKKENKITFVIQ